MNSSIKILECLLKNDTLGLIESIKNSLDQKSSSRIKAQIDEASIKYLTERKNIDILSNMISKGKRNSKVELSFKDGNDIDVDFKTANGLISLHSALTGSQKNKVEQDLEKSIDSFMRLVKFAKDKNLI